MSKSEDNKFNLKNASESAKKLIKNISRISKRDELLLSVIILAIGVALGIVFDEFALFLGIAVALDIVFYIISNEKEE